MSHKTTLRVSLLGSTLALALILTGCTKTGSSMSDNSNSANADTSAVINQNSTVNSGDANSNMNADTNASGTDVSGTDATNVNADKSQDVNTNAKTNTETNSTGSTNTKTFTVHGNNYSYDIKTITVKKGDHVKVTFIDDQGFHNVVVEGYGVATPNIEQGDNASIEFTADKVGTFAYYCSVDHHREKGMVGQLIVQ